MDAEEGRPGSLDARDAIFIHVVVVWDHGGRVKDKLEVWDVLGLLLLAGKGLGIGEVGDHDAFSARVNVESRVECGCLGDPATPQRRVQVVGCHVHVCP